MNLRRVFDLTAGRIAGKLAFVDGSERKTYRDWAGDVYALGHALGDLGMQKGDRVVILMRNSLAHGTATAAVVAAGAVSVPFNVKAAPTTMVQVVTDADAKILILDDPDFIPVLEQAGLDLASMKVVVDDGRQGAPAGSLAMSDLVASGVREPVSVDIADHDLANILYTSGTTGMPKGIPHQHGHIYERMLGWLAHFGPVMSSGVRTLGVTPMYHITGYHCVFWYTILLNGTYYVPKARDTESMLEQIQEEKLTYVAAAPIVLDRMVDVARQKTFDLSSVDTVVPGSAPKPPMLMEDLREVFPSALFGEAYGTSEGVMLGAVDLFEKPGAFQVIGDMTARVVKPGGEPDDIVDDEVEGELIVKMDSLRIVHEYWKRSDETAERFRHGWAYSGDAAHRDAEGDIFIHGRLDDFFLSGAENLQPAEIETILLEHPDIADCAVIGTPEPQWGEWCTAFVVKGRADLTIDEIDEYCRSTQDLADFKRPRRYVFVDDIERNPTGKVPRKEYRQRWIDGVYETMELGIDG